MQTKGLSWTWIRKCVDLFCLGSAEGSSVGGRPASPSKAEIDNNSVNNVTASESKLLTALSALSAMILLLSKSQRTQQLCVIFKWMQKKTLVRRMQCAPKWMSHQSSCCWTCIATWVKAGIGLMQRLPCCDISPACSLAILQVDADFRSASLWKHIYII